VSCSKAFVLCSAVIDPVSSRLFLKKKSFKQTPKTLLSHLNIHRTQFPLCRHIRQAADESLLLFGIRNREPVLNQVESAFNQHVFKHGTLFQKQLVLFFRAESHHLVQNSTNDNILNSKKTFSTPPRLYQDLFFGNQQRTRNKNPFRSKPIKKDNFARRWQMLNVSLKIPPLLLSFSRSSQSDNLFFS
jgi:hypothetical protein